MKAHVCGLGEFGMFLADFFLKIGWTVNGCDTNPKKKPMLESLGGTWGDADADIRFLAVFPEEISNVPDDGSLVVNLSSVQQPGLARLAHLGVADNRLMSIHPLFGPVGVSKTGLRGKQIVLTKVPVGDERAEELLYVLKNNGVWLEQMTPEEHDTKMLSHALAFYFGELIEVSTQDCDPKFLTGSASHMIGLLQFTGRPGSKLSELILSNPAMKKAWQAIEARNLFLADKFGWR
jgi:prephenate dehydrogenase